MRKPGARRHRRLRQDDFARLEYQRAAEIVTKVHGAAELTTSERNWLVRLLQCVMSDVDVRDRFFEAVAGAPSRVGGRNLWIAADYHARVAERGGVRGVAKTVAAAWKLPDAKQVAVIARENREFFDLLKHNDPATLRVMIDGQIPRATGRRTPPT